MMHSEPLGVANPLIYMAKWVEVESLILSTTNSLIYKEF